MQTRRSGAGGHVFFAEELVVGADAVSIEVVFFGLAQNERDLGKENLAIDAVLILFGEALLGARPCRRKFQKSALVWPNPHARRARCG